MTSNLLELQEMLRNLDMGSVQKVAQGQSGKAAQLLGMDEIKRRGEQMQAAKAEEAEQGVEQPPMVDQFLAASQQMMGQPAPMPPQMAQAMPPQQQGIGSIMPQAPMQQPKMPPQMPMGQPPQQMPPQMMAGGGQVGTDLMRKPDMSNFGIVEYLMSQGMSREEAEAQARSATGGSQPLNVGGFIQKYKDGGTVLGGDEYGSIYDAEELEGEDPSLISEIMQWAGENPGKVALLGAGVSLLPGGLALRGLSAGAKLLVPRVLPLLNRGRAVVGAAGRKVGMKPTGNPATLTARAGQSVDPKDFRFATDLQLGREILGGSARNKALRAGLGAGAAGTLASMAGGEDGFENFGAPFPVDPNAQEEPSGDGGIDSILEDPERAEVPVSEGFWNSLIALGGRVASEENVGEGIGLGIQDALKVYTASQARAEDRADKDFNREVSLEDRKLNRRLVESQIRRNDQSGTGRGSLNDNQAAVRIDEYLSRAGKMPGDPDYENMRAQLMQIFKAYGTEGLFQAFAEGRRDESAELQAMVFG